MCVELENVDKEYHRGGETVHALQGASFALRPGSMTALVGPSGCGKSTCLNLVAGVDRPDRGFIRVCGVEIGSASEGDLLIHRRERIGIVFQSFHLLPHLTVEENAALPMSLGGRRDPERVRYLIDRVGLDHRRGHYPSELSGGEQQRTAVARALVHKPALVLADEPTGNLDRHSGSAILELMDELRREEGATLLIATHDEKAAAMADEIIRMVDGRVEAPALP